jgi:hypothetical protein
MNYKNKVDPTKIPPKRRLAAVRNKKVAPPDNPFNSRLATNCFPDYFEV